MNIVERVPRSPHYDTFTFRQTARELDEAVTWLKGQGRRVDGTRIARYHKDLHRLANDHEAGRLKGKFEANLRHEKAQMYRDILVSLYESGEVISIYYGIKALAAVLEPEKLRDLLKGQISYIDEKADSSKARDTCFELIVASRLAQVGLELTPLPPADVAVALGKHRLVFECKRPQLLTSVEDNFAEAFSQLRAHLIRRTVPRLRGIAAVDITKAVNPGFNTLRTETEEELAQKLSDGCVQYARGQMPLWVRIATPKIIGVLLRFSAIAEIVRTSIPVYAQQYTLVGLAPPGTADHAVADRLAKLLNRPSAWANASVFHERKATH